MAYLSRYLKTNCVAGLVMSIICLPGCAKITRTIENDAFMVTVIQLNPSSFDPFIMRVYLEPKGDKQFQMTKLLKIEGPNDFEGEFLSRDLLVLRSLPPKTDFSASRLHFLLRVPMECIGTIEMRISEFFYPYARDDSIPYAIYYSGSRQVSLQRTWLNKVFIINTDDTTKIRDNGLIHIAPVEKLDGELIHEDTLRLSVTWCGEDTAQEILVKLPTSKREDLEYAVRE